MSKDLELKKKKIRHDLEELINTANDYLEEALFNLAFDRIFFFRCEVLGVRY